MPIRFVCVCGKLLTVGDELAGKRIRCPACQHVVDVPTDAVEVQLEEAEVRQRGRPRRRDMDDGVQARARRDAWEDDDEDRPRRRPRKQSSTNLPLIIGSVVGGVALLVLICGGMLLMSVQRIRQAANGMSNANNLKMIGIAMLNYHDFHGRFPSQALMSPRGKPLLSWRVAILEYVEGAQLYHQFHLDEPWDSPHNKSLLPLMPKVFARPGDDPQTGMTHYLAFVGSHTVIGKKKPVGFANIPDGTSNTIMLAQAEASVPWTKPEDLDWEGDGPIPQLDNWAGNGFPVVFANASVAALASDIPPDVLKALVRRDDHDNRPVEAWIKR